MRQNTNLPLPQLMKVPEVAAILNISRSMAYRLVSSNEIASVRFRHSVRVRPDDLEAFIQAKLTKTN